MARGAFERRKKRDERKKKQDDEATEQKVTTDKNNSDSKIANLLAQNEDDLLNFVVQVNKVYQEKLKRPAPFMTFVICGMQSAGKSTIMERFMSAVLNIVQEGTGTRCPLDTTCIHDESLIEPRCELSGEELNPEECGEDLTINDVFSAITDHNKKLAQEDRFSTKSLRLVYRADNVQNMRFVDTPGIISNKGQGQDNRMDIQKILKDTMKKPNSKLCVLLEPKEYSTNAIIDFCDETFGDREVWVGNAIFLMTKFDQKLHDARTGSKANKFFKEYYENGMKPHLVITPTLPKEDLPMEELFKQRKELLNNASEDEHDQFKDWIRGHEKFLQENPDDELLEEQTKNQIGFSTAKKLMREVMLADTANRLPEVLAAIRTDLADCQNELLALKEKRKFNDPKEVRMIVGQVLEEVHNRIIAYLDGDLETVVKFPDILETLDDELEGEEASEWCKRELNHHSGKEDEWRDRMSDLDYQPEMQAQKEFLGGKQYQRAVFVFGQVMVDALPDPFELKEYVASGSGYLQGGLQRENWERAITAITKMTMKKISHPGINFLIKHVGYIFRRLFNIALDDVKQGEEFSTTFQQMPREVENYLCREFDKMLWELMLNAAEKAHIGMEPMYSTINPSLPTFHPEGIEKDDDEQTFTRNPYDNTYSETPSKRDSIKQGLVERLTNKVNCFLSLDDSNMAKEMLRNENKRKATEKKHFLPDERSAMMTDEESSMVIRRAFQYIIALMEWILVILEFYMNHYLYEGFKNQMSSFSRKIITNDWTDMLKPDQKLDDQVEEIEDKIAGLQESLQEIQRLQAKF